MFGGEVNKTTGENVCTKAQLDGGNVCGVGTEGSTSGQFGVQSVLGVAGGYIAVDPAGTVYVGDRDRIQEFEPNGVYKGEIDFEEVHNEHSGFPEKGNPGALSFDAKTGALYFAFTQDPGTAIPNVFKLSATTGKFLDEIEVKVPAALAVDATGDVNVLIEYADKNFPKPEVLKFDINGSLIDNCCAADILPGNKNEVRFRMPGLATNPVGDLYAINTSQGVDSYIRAFGPPPVEFEAPPLIPPSVNTEYAVSVANTSAYLGAEINPHFWEDTQYYVQYGTGDCSTNPCAEVPVAPGAKLTTQVVDAPTKTANVLVDGLQPHTTYHYRFVAQSSGGGPVFGEDHSFITFPEPAPRPCSGANQQFRTGLSAALPDCRAYEMVSPLDKDNGDIRALPNLAGYPTGLYQSSSDGGKIAYTSYRAFADPEAGPYTSQYIASRDPSAGWVSEAISPRRGSASFFVGGEALETQFKAFSADLCSGWLRHETDPPLDPAAPAGFAGLYRRDNCGGGTYEALSRALPTSNAFNPEFQGACGDRAFFRVKQKLAIDSGPEASSAGSFQIYESVGGKLQLVSVLPNGQASTGNASLGTANSKAVGRFQNLAHAISSDCSRAFWTTGGTGTNGEGPGTIYSRAIGESPVTIKVSESVTPEPAYFQTASVDGSKVFFTVEGGALKGNLYEFNVASQTAALIAKKVLANVLGSSEDASRVYFVSEEALGTGATPGKLNLYLDEGGAPSNGGTIRFIAMLSAADKAIAQSVTGSPVSKLPVIRSARVTPDGQQVLFTSDASLTGYENIDVNSGELDTEVYLYDAGANEGAGKLSCVSCNPSGARPAGQELISKPWEERWVAAHIPTFQNQLYAPHALSADGKRVFFNSFDGLVLSDTNGKEDPYEWEAPGKGDCATDSPSYVESSGGCLSLISSGESSANSEFLDASPDGENVFFSTESSLLPQDYGLVDIYDARVGGGFPPLPSPPAACEGEACQHPAPAPNDPTPSSSTFSGPGNLHTKKKKAKKGHHKKKKHHKKKHQKNKQRHGKQHRQGRAAR